MVIYGHVQSGESLSCLMHMLPDEVEQGKAQLSGLSPLQQ